MEFELILAEKQKAAKKIAEALALDSTKRIHGVELYYKQGTGLLVGYSSGHIAKREYPPKYHVWRNINFKKLIAEEPLCIYDVTYSKYLKTVLSEYTIHTLSLYTDNDMEGELIAKDLASLCSTYCTLNFRRYRTSSLTKSAILKGISANGVIDVALAESAQTKHWIDLQWGALLSVMFTLYAKVLYTLGRVQTPVLSLLVDRYQEINTYIPKQYLQFVAKVDNLTFLCNVNKELESAKQQLYSRVEPVSIQETINKGVEKKPAPPLNSTDLLKYASKLHIDGKRLMSLAESLYLKGLVTYPRTDSRYTTFEEIKRVTTKPCALFNIDLSGSEAYSIVVGAPDPAHPPIMPTGEMSEYEKLTKEQITLYKLILQHYVDILKGVTVVDVHKYNFSISDYSFEYTSEKTIRVGYREYVPFLPPSQGMLTEITRVSKTTKPPAAYTEKTIVKRMELLKIGTKSTRHTFVSLLRSRGYITKFTPTPRGVALIHLLRVHCPFITSAQFTAKIETALSDITAKRNSKAAVFSEYSTVLSGFVDGLVRARAEIQQVLRNLS